MNPDRQEPPAQNPHSVPAADPLLAALARLPRETAAPDFTARVLARVGKPAGEGESTDWEIGLPWSRGWTAFAASLALVSVISAWQWERQERRRDWLGEVEALRRESQTLGAELSDLRAAEQAPIVYLGGDDRVDLVLDLEELRRARARGTVPGAAADGAQPVNLRGQQFQQGETL